MKSILKRFIKNIVFKLPPYYRSYVPGYINGKVYRDYLRYIDNFEKLSEDEKNEKQKLKLTKILECARQNEYYSKILKEDYNKVPFLTRKVIQNNNLLTVNKEEKIIKSHTSGSTGQPLAIYRTKNENQKENANIDYLLIKSGINIFRRVRYLNLRNNTKQFLDQEGDIYYIPPSYVNEKNIKEIVREIKKIDPHIIHAHPSIIYSLVQLLKNSNINIKLNNLRVILVSSEIFSDEMKERVYHYFKCNILDYYSNEENSICGYRIYPHMLYMKFPKYYSYVEVIENELVSTSLSSEIMPLIRYKTGDRITEKNLEKVKYILGRTNEYLIDKFGDKVPLENFSTYEYENVYFYQFVDKGKGEIEFRVQGLANKKINVGKILGQLRKINDKFNYKIIEVNEIKRINNKHKILIRGKDEK